MMTQNGNQRILDELWRALSALEDELDPGEWERLRVKLAAWLDLVERGDEGDLLQAFAELEFLAVSYGLHDVVRACAVAREEAAPCVRDPALHDRDPYRTLELGYADGGRAVYRDGRLERTLGAGLEAYRSGAPEHPRGAPDPRPARRSAISRTNAFCRLRHIVGAPARPAAAAARSPMETYPEARAPEVVTQGERFRLEVCARAKPAAGAAGAPMLLERTMPGPIDLEVEVRPESGAMEAEGSLTNPLRIQETGDSAMLVFDLLAVTPGDHEVQVIFRQDGFERAVLRPRVKVVAERARVPPANAAGASAPSDARTGAVVSLLAVASPTPGLVLHIIERGVSGDDRFLDVTLTGSARLISRPITGTQRLTAKAPDVLHNLCRKLDTMVRPATERTARENLLRGLGAALARELLPESIRETLSGDRYPAGTPLQIETEDPWVPWELLWFGGLDDGRFLGEWYAVTRWLRRGSLWDLLPGGSALFVAPRTSGLTVDDERDALLRLCAARGGRLQELSSLADVQGWLKGRDPCGFVHFACHGAAPATRDSLGGILRLDEGHLHPFDLPEIPAHAFAAGPAVGPLRGACVVFNACDAAISSRGLSGHGAWADAVFRAGAAAFVAPSWSVSDGCAQVFAKKFYRTVADGVTLGEAARRARIDARFEGDPDRLGYAVYALPGARVEGR